MKYSGIMEIIANVVFDGAQASRGRRGCQEEDQHQVLCEGGKPAQQPTSRHDH